MGLWKLPGRSSPSALLPGQGGLWLSAPVLIARVELAWIQDRQCWGPLGVKEPSGPPPHRRSGGGQSRGSSIVQRGEPGLTGFADLTLEPHR